MKFGVAAGLMSVLLVLCAGGLLHGQTAAEMDGLLESGEITWEQACRFVLSASGALGEHAPAPAAFALAQEEGWLPKGAAAEGPVNLGGLSFLMSGAFSIKGSVLYALFPGPRYAYRQLDYLGLIPGLRDPAMKVSGERLVQILGRVLDYRGDGEPDVAAYSAVTEREPAEGNLEVPAGEGLSSGPEGLIPYEEGFILE
jgi:hypothetical protein